MSSLPDDVLFRIAIRVQNEIVLTCPVDTGRLRNSLKVKQTKQGIIIWGVGYLQFVEFGTNRQRPNPFVRNVINNKLPQIIQEEIAR